MDPILTQTVSLNGFALNSVRLGKPVKSTSFTWLPFQTKGMSSVKVSWCQLVNGTDSIRLKGLLLGTSDWFIWLGLCQICAIEKRVDGRISFITEILVPCLCRKSSMAILCGIFTSWGTTRLWTIVFNSRRNL